MDEALDAALDELDDEEVENSKEPVKQRAPVATAAAPASHRTTGMSRQEIFKPEPPTTKSKSGTILSSEKSAPEAKKSPAKVDAPFIGPPRPPQMSSSPTPQNFASSSSSDEEKALLEMMEGLLGAASELGEGLGDDDFSGNPEQMMQKLMEQMQAQFESELRSGEGATASSNKPAATKNGEKKASKTASKPKQKDSTSQSSSNNVGDVISNLVDDMAKQSSENEGESQREPMDEAKLFESLLQGLSGGVTGEDGPGFDADTVIDGMMEQLLSKDLMYEPIKQVASKFPAWLEESRNYLSEKEFKECVLLMLRIDQYYAEQRWSFVIDRTQHSHQQTGKIISSISPRLNHICAFFYRRSKQCELYQKLVRCYETTPEDTKRLTDLMQQVHEYGQPPPEIIKEVAPGLELDADGMPKFDSSGLPMGLNANEEECRIM